MGVIEALLHQLNPPCENRGISQHHRGPSFHVYFWPAVFRSITSGHLLQMGITSVSYDRQTANSKVHSGSSLLPKYLSLSAVGPVATQLHKRLGCARKLREEWLSAGCWGGLPCADHMVKFCKS